MDVLGVERSQRLVGRSHLSKHSSSIWTRQGCLGCVPVNAFSVDQRGYGFLRFYLSPLLTVRETNEYLASLVTCV